MKTEEAKADAEAAELGEGAAQDPAAPEPEAPGPAAEGRDAAEGAEGVVSELPPRVPRGTRDHGQRPRRREGVKRNEAKRSEATMRPRDEA